MRTSPRSFTIHYERESNAVPNVSPNFSQPSTEIRSKILKLPISDDKLTGIGIEECNDKIVGLDPNNIRIVSTDDPRFGNGEKGRIKTDPPTMREPVYTMLCSALKNLPDDFGIAVYEGYRTQDKQCEYFNNKFNEIKNQKPHLTAQEVEAETSKWVANPNGKLVQPHSTGAAVDVQLFRIENPESPDDQKQFSFVDVGKFGAIFGENPHPETLSEKDLNEEQWSNRQTLLTAMVEAGFVNYGMEHWHYSYGDQAACFVNGEETARYGSLWNA